MKRRLLALLLAGSMIISLTACGGSTADKAASQVSSATESQTAEAEEEAPAESVVESQTAEVEAETEVEIDVFEEDTVDDDSWDEMEALGKIETENGLMTVTITVPADFIGEDITQDSLDAKAGTNYLKATLNEDGSVSYKMTKAQHKAMMDTLAESFVSSIQEMIDDEECSFTEITYNDNFTQFDVKLSTEELDFADSLNLLEFYMCGGMYGLFSGTTPVKVIVNFYNVNGDLIKTVDSSQLGEE